MTEQDVELFSGHEGRNTDQYRLPEVNYVREELELRGYCIIPGHMAASEIEECRDDIDRLLTRQEAEFGAENLRRINDHGVVRSPFLHSPAIRKLCLDGKTLEIVKCMFGRQSVLHLNRAVISDPAVKHPATIWHREPPYVDFVSSRPVALTFIHTIDESNAHNGGVSLLSGSHKWDRFPSSEFVRRNEITPDIPAGSILVFNSMVFHCGTENRSSALRRSLVTIYTIPTLKQQVNIPQMLRDQQLAHLADEIPDGKFLLGFDTEQRVSDEEYRRKKIEALVNETQM